MVDHDQVRREHGYHPLRVKAVIDETSDAQSFVLEVPDDVADLFSYRAGQFCTFRVTIDGEEHLRSYSMSSAPETDTDLRVTVKRVADGKVSNWLHDHVSAGDILEATKPSGVFCADKSDRQIVAFCGGSGVTPVISIAESALASTSRSMHVLYANRDRESVIFREHWDELAAANPGRLHVHHHLDDELGFLDALTIERFVGDLGADFFICGPGPFMDLVETTLLDLGVPPERIAIERFVNAGQDIVTTELEAEAEAAAGAGDAAGADDALPTTVTIILKKKKHAIEYQAGDTILETARRGALQAPFSCESGNCATCMALMIEGSATMRANNALNPDEVEEGWVLTCQAIPHGEAVTVEYESF